MMTPRVTGHGLVLPTDVVDESRALAAAYTRYLAACYQRFLTIEPELPWALRPAHGRIATLVREVAPRSQRQLLHCFASPMVGTPLHCVELAQRLEEFRSRIEKAAAEMMPHLLLEMALRRIIPDGQSILWEVGAPPLASLAIGGELIPPAGATGLRFCSDHVAALGNGVELARLLLGSEAMPRALTQDTCGFRFERRFQRVSKVTSFATIDHNPIAAFEAHPEKAGNHVDLGGHSEQEWTEVLDRCFALIEPFMPGEFAEMGVMLHQVIPVGYHDVRHLSASYREAIGTVYLTLHPNVMTMTEAVIHEFQHNKFNVAAHSVEFLSNAFHPLYKSPVRPDPRPLWGILLAVHAFLPVGELYRRMRDGGHPWGQRADFLERMSDIDLKNHEGMEMLRTHAQFTTAGRALFSELESLEHRHLADRAARGLDSKPVAAHVG
jgi:HEXXH motif-containing protein